MDYPNFDLEKSFWKERKLVAGIDEAGRGPLAGPVVAAAVVFPFDFISEMPLNDSKLLTHNKRAEFLEYIKNSCMYQAHAFIDNNEIDRINILQATIKAMHVSVSKLQSKPAHLLIDGNYFRENGIAHTTVKSGDKISTTIAAASIIAKVTRDLWMIEVAGKEFPEYDFKNNKGYGTKKHIEAIKKYGICKYHRLSFLKNYGF